MTVGGGGADQHLGILGPCKFCLQLVYEGFMRPQSECDLFACKPARGVLDHVQPRARYHVETESTVLAGRHHNPALHFGSRPFALDANVVRADRNIPASASNDMRGEERVTITTSWCGTRLGLPTVGERGPDHRLRWISDDLPLHEDEIRSVEGRLLPQQKEGLPTLPNGTGSRA